MRVFHCRSCHRRMHVGHFRCDYCETKAPARNWIAPWLVVALVLLVVYLVLF